MSDDLPGPHHCISTARLVTDVVFRSLRAKCQAEGGLSLEQLESYYSQIIESFSSGYDLFELRYHRCMAASMSLAPKPFDRAMILATLLRAGGEKSARAAFLLQVERFGMAWTSELFEGLANYLRKNLKTNVDGRLINAYVDAAATPDAKLTIDGLLKLETIRDILLECLGPLKIKETEEAEETQDIVVKNVCDEVNRHIAERRAIDHADVCKVTEDQIRRFLILLPAELRMATQQS